MIKNRRKPRSNTSYLPTILVVAILIAGIAVLYKRFDAQASTSKAKTLPSKEFSYVPLQDLGTLDEVITNPELPSIEKRYTGMNLSFNPELHIPNWVAWELTRDEVKGTIKRKDNFRADPEINGCPTLDDYRRSGYTRGHMAPSADFKWSAEAMEDACYLTNIVPQLSTLNSGIWSTIESKCRDWAVKDSAIYIVCGPVVDGNPLDYIGQSQVYVPSKFFKAIISPYAHPLRGIGFIVPHKGHKGGMQTATVSIDEIEKITGHDFFASLPDSLENNLEAQNNFLHWTYDTPQ